MGSELKEIQIVCEIYKINYVIIKQLAATICLQLKVSHIFKICVRILINRKLL